MNASDSDLEVRSKRLRKEEEIEDGEDRISDLPKDILSQILSYLSTTDAVRTSIYSTKWKYLWTSVTSLNFDDSKGSNSSRSNQARRLKFITFVERALLLHENPTIENFSLQCDDTYDASHIKTWITAVIRRKKVQTLNISLGSKTTNEYFVFPSCLYDCDSLIELNLCFPGILSLPNSVSFSKLQILELSRVVLSTFLWVGFQFPVLELLKLIDCEWRNMKLINIDAPLLEHFVIRNSKYTFSLNGARNPTTEWLFDIPTDFRLNICSQSLTSFECESNFTEHMVLPSPSLVSSVVLEVSTYFRSDRMRNPSVGIRSWLLLTRLGSLKHLTLSGDLIKALQIPEVLASLSNFSTLAHLELPSAVCFEKSFVALLRVTPVLESLTFSQRILEVSNSLPQAAVPECFHSHLKLIKFRVFLAKEHEIRLIKYFLENTRVLEEFALNFCKVYDHVKIKRNDVKKLLRSFPKGSASAKLTFSGTY